MGGRARGRADVTRRGPAWAEALEITRPKRAKQTRPGLAGRSDGEPIPTAFEPAAPRRAFSAPTREWYERRLTGWGSSEAPQLLGISRWKPARVAVEEKARRIIPDPDAPERLRLRLGRELEPVLALHLLELGQERGLLTAGRYRRSSRLYRLRAAPFVIANVDGFADDALAELKTDAFGYEPWGPEDGDPARSVPAMYYAQVQHALAATGRRRALLLALIGLNDRKLYEIPRHETFILGLLEVEEAAWAAVTAARARLAQDPDADIEDLLPAFDASPASAALLRKRYPVDDGLILPATAEQEQRIGELRAAKIAELEAHRRYLEAETRVVDAIGPAAGLSSSLGTVTFRRPADADHVEWEKAADAYRAMLEKLGADPDALARIVQEYTSTREGSRRIWLPRAWSKSGAVPGE
jgi:predicted phage-related endonuclease